MGFAKLINSQWAQTNTSPRAEHYHCVYVLGIVVWIHLIDNWFATPLRYHGIIYNDFSSGECLGCWICFKSPHFSTNRFQGTSLLLEVGLRLCVYATMSKRITGTAAKLIILQLNLLYACTWYYLFLQLCEEILLTPSTNLYKFDISQDVNLNHFSGCVSG